jgi:GntR family transcriptional regulator
LEVDRLSPLPLYHQLKQILLQAIHQGDIGPGEILPSEKELEEQYGVSRMTVRRALGDLASEGYVSRQRGRGTFVLDPKIEYRSDTVVGLRQDLVNRGFAVESEVVQDPSYPAPRYVAHRLGVGEGHPILYVQRRMLVDGEPFVLSRNYCNLPETTSFAPEELANQSLRRLIETRCGISSSRVDRTVEATLALGDDAALLQVRVNSPLLLVRLVVSDMRQCPVIYAADLFRADRYQYQHTTIL